LRSKRLLFNGLSSTNRFTNFSKSRSPRISSSLCPPPQRDARFGEETCDGFVDERFLFRARAFSVFCPRYYEDQSVLSFLSSLLLNSVKRRIYKKCAAERARQTSCSFSALFWSLCFDFFIFLVVVLFFFSLLFSSLSLSLSVLHCFIVNKEEGREDKRSEEEEEEEIREEEEALFVLLFFYRVFCSFSLSRVFCARALVLSLSLSLSETF
jgi:hypothetical protein